MPAPLPPPPGDRAPLDVLVIGAGQAGLALGHHLARRGVDVLLVDAGPEIGHSWRSRWDSLRLFSPAQYDSLPGLPFPAAADTHPSKDDVADYLADYAAHFQLRVRLNSPVLRLHRDEGGTFTATTPTEMLRATRIACLDDLLALPNGLETRIGEAGLRLSGGEEQRLQLARAIYREPRVLFLDEATSHLDASLERAITEALQREAAGRTLVVVAHRLSTVRRADHIVVLEKGRVVEQGTHEELVAIPGGRYRSLVENQLEG